ncbi:MAG: MFS transporter [Candidatus Hodarchaeota archaeon]
MEDYRQKESSEKEAPLSPEIDDYLYKTETMSLSIREGLFGGLSQSLADQFITPYALNLYISPTQIGIMSSLLGIMSPIGQIIGSNRMKKQSRRNIMLKAISFQLLMWPLIILLGIFAINNWYVSILPIFLISFYILYSFFGSISGPSWFSLMGDIVPEHHRGRYFSKRNLIITAISITISLLASVALDEFVRLNRLFLGFFIIFFIAFLTRATSLFLLMRHYYPPFTIEKQSYISLKKFLKEIPNNNFGIFTLFMGFIYFSVHIGAPFVGVYMLKVLNFSYIEYVLVNLSTPLLGILFSPLLGYLSDKYGNALLLKICGLLLPTVPILWIVMNTPVQLIFGPQLVSAFAWIGVNLATSNFIYDNISTQQRGFYISYYSFFIGFGILFGGLLGSYLINIVPILFVCAFETLFLISGILRLFVDAIFLWRIKEVRVTRS